MIHGYHEDYVSFVMGNFGKMFDIALRQMGMEPEEFQDMLIGSSAADSIYKGEHRYIVGMSGTELLQSIMGDEGILDIDPLHPPGKEYWAGYVAAYAQWFWFRSFRELFESIPIRELMGLYNPYHEADISKVNELIGRRLVMDSIIKVRRKRLGLTQRRLSEITGISLATIRAYEQGSLDPCKAQAESIYVLSKALGCSMEELLRGRRRGSGLPATGAVSPLAGDVDDVPAELGLDDGHVADVVTEGGILEGLDHLAAAEPAQVPALVLGGALGPLHGQLGEIGTGVDLVVDVVSFLLGVHQDVGAARFSYHGGAIVQWDKK